MRRVPSLRYSMETLAHAAGASGGSRPMPHTPRSSFGVRAGAQAASDELIIAIRLAVRTGSMLPNETRLSCGATLKHSQMEFYHTARRTFAGLIEEGRRQLQAHVRPQRSSAAACRMAHSSPDTARPTST